MIGFPPIEILPGLSVSRETYSKLEQFEQLVRKWTAHINLVSTNSLGAIWDRHIIDSAQLIRFLPKKAAHWADIGSGAGFPGFVIGILAQECAPGFRLTLVESDQRKATFLRTACREIGVSATILTSRIEDTDPIGADILSARALGTLSQLLGYADRHLAPNGESLFLKGRNVEVEITEARLNWSFDMVCYPSMTNAEAQILRIENVSHA